MERNARQIATARALSGGLLGRKTVEATRFRCMTTEIENRSAEAPDAAASCRIASPQDVSGFPRAGRQSPRRQSEHMGQVLRQELPQRAAYKLVWSPSFI